MLKTESPVPGPPSTVALPARPSSSPASSCAGTGAVRTAGGWQIIGIGIVSSPASHV